MTVTGCIWRLVSLLVALAYAWPTEADDRAASPGAESDSSIHGAFNNGEDFTRPLTRVDLRERYECLPDEGGLEPKKWVTTLRTDLWTGVGEGWKLYGRADLPLVYSNDVTSRRARASTRSDRWSAFATVFPRSAPAASF